MEGVMKFSEMEVSNSRRVFVVNGTNPIGTVCMTVLSGENTQVPIRIPKTWIPIELSEQVDKGALLKSHSFRQAVFNGTLVLIKPEAAIKTLESEEGKAEDANVRERMRSMAATGTLSEQTKSEEDPLAAIAPQVIEIMGREGISDVERFNELRTIESQLTKEDCEYVAKKASSSKLTEHMQALAQKKDK